MKKIVLLVSLCLISCSETKSNRYQDTSHLEAPPQLIITEKPKAPTEEESESKESESKGLGDYVLFDQSEKQAFITIKKHFPRAWNIVTQAIELNNIEITDKNREQGIFYVTFDPDSDESEDSTFIDTMTFFFFKDEYKEANYKLTVSKQENSVQVTAELNDVKEDDILLDDEGDDFDALVDDGTKLLKTLYGTIKNDLPVNKATRDK